MLGLGKDAMDSVVPVKADSMSELVLGRSDDQLLNVKMTNSRMRYVNDRNGWEAILQRIVICIDDLTEE